MINKVKGVYLDKRHNTWQSSIKIDGKKKHLGSFETKEEAIAARKAGEIKYGYAPVTPAPKLKHRDDLTQKMLKELLHYNPDTGDFTWKVKTANRNKIGSIAGCTTNEGYILIMINNKSYLAHQLAFLYMNGKFPEKGLQVDHINHIRDDNKWVNFRLVTNQENQKNRSISKNNTTGCMGVYWNDNTQKYRARINIDGKLIHLGSFNTYEEAVSARKAAELKYNFHENHGKLNQNQIKEVS